MRTFWWRLGHKEVRGQSFGSLPAWLPVSLVSSSTLLVSWITLLPLYCFADVRIQNLLASIMDRGPATFLFFGTTISGFEAPRHMDWTATGFSDSVWKEPFFFFDYPDYTVQVNLINPLLIFTLLALFLSSSPVQSPPNPAVYKHPLFIFLLTVLSARNWLWLGLRIWHGLKSSRVLCLCLLRWLLGFVHFKADFQVVGGRLRIFSMSSGCLLGVTCDVAFLGVSDQE